MKDINRNIEYLDDWQHMLLRPVMYIGSVEPMEDKIPIIDNGVLVSKNKTYSVGMYRLFDEVLDNAFDEALRCYNENHPMKYIQVEIDTIENSVTVIDSGKGFKDAIKKNKKTQLTNVETALTKLRAGSNFQNDETEAHLIGTNGIGISATNVFSEFFEITTKNSNSIYYHLWNNFETVSSKPSYSKNKNTGTTIKFIPRKSIFKDETWDIEIIKTKLIFRNFIKNNDETLKNIKFIVKINGEDVSVKDNFLPKDYEFINLNKKVKILLWRSYENSTSISFVNGSLCTGFHQKYIHEYINTSLFNYDKAHQFYNTCIILDLPPKYVLFQEQNKNRFVTTRDKLETILKLNILKKDIREFQSNKLYSNIKNDIDNYLKNDDYRKIKKAKKSNKIILSDKFISSIKKDSLLIVEGNSAGGSTSQLRNPEIHAIYKLRGKVKNPNSVMDLSQNTELLELINILNLNLEDKGSSCDYSKIIIAADMDFDGNHISSLLINFFYRWYPNIIKENKLFVLQTPIVAIDGKQTKYFYNLNDINISNNTNNVRYLKGLGSLDIDDWKHVYSDMKLLKITDNENSVNILNIAFGKDSSQRKVWLMK